MVKRVGRIMVKRVGRIMVKRVGRRVKIYENNRKD